MASGGRRDPNPALALGLVILIGLPAVLLALMGRMAVDGVCSTSAPPAAEQALSREGVSGPRMVGPITFECRSETTSWTVTDARPLLFGLTTLGGAALLIWGIYRYLTRSRVERLVDVQRRGG